METLYFPKLGFGIELNRVAFSIGDFHIYWYGILIALPFWPDWYMRFVAPHFWVRPGSDDRRNHWRRDRRRGGSAALFCGL